MISIPQDTVDLKRLIEMMAGDFGITVTNSSLEIKEDMPLEEFVKFSQSVIDPVAQLDGSIKWWLGKVINYGENHWGEEYAQVFDSIKSHHRPNALSRYSKVERLVPADNRKGPPLYFTHHEIVSRLPPESQREALAYAEESGITTTEFAKWVKETYPTGADQGRKKIIKKTWDEWFDNYCMEHGLSVKDEDRNHGKTYVPPQVLQLMKDSFDAGITGKA